MNDAFGKEIKPGARIKYERRGHGKNTTYPTATVVKTIVTERVGKTEHRIYAKLDVADSWTQQPILRNPSLVCVIG